MKFGGIDVTPSLVPVSDQNGSFLFDFVIPRTGAGVHTIELNVDGRVDTVDFIVTEINPSGK